MTPTVLVPETVREQGDQVFVDAAAMIRLVHAIFIRAGCHDDEAERIAVRLTGANLRGHDSHGIIRAARYVEWIESGQLVPNQTISVESENESIAVVDGHFGFGQSIGEQTVDLGIAKARERGVAVTALKNAGHLGRIGDWAERAAGANMASIHMVNVRGSLLVAPFGGVDRTGSTSPFCCGVPVAGEDPIIHDFATSLVAEGKALVALQGGKPLPEGAVITRDGELTSDPMPVYGELEPGRLPDYNKGTAALTGFGLHKGAGLNFSHGDVCWRTDPGPAPPRRSANPSRGDYATACCRSTWRWISSTLTTGSLTRYAPTLPFVKSSCPATPGVRSCCPARKRSAPWPSAALVACPCRAWPGITSSAQRGPWALVPRRSWRRYKSPHEARRGGVMTRADEIPVWERAATTARRRLAALWLRL